LTGEAILSQDSGGLRVSTGFPLRLFFLFPRPLETRAEADHRLPLFARRYGRLTKFLSSRLAFFSPFFPPSPLHQAPILAVYTTVFPAFVLVLVRPDVHLADVTSLCYSLRLDPDPAGPERNFISRLPCSHLEQGRRPPDRPRRPLFPHFFPPFEIPLSGGSLCPSSSMQDTLVLARTRRRRFWRN